MELELDVADGVRACGVLPGAGEGGARAVLTGHGEPWAGGIEAAVAQAQAAGAA